jgi:hypothetical protein
MRTCKNMTDLTVENHGSIFLLRPLTVAASTWLVEHVAWETEFGDAIVVEPRYVRAIVEGALDAGLVVR